MRSVFVTYKFMFSIRRFDATAPAIESQEVIVIDD